MTLGDAAGQWPRSTLGAVAQWGSGGTPQRTNSRYFGGSIPWIVIGDLNDGLVVDAATYITEEGLAKSSAKWVEPGAVLVAMYGSIGKLGIAGRRLTTNQAIAFANPLPGMSGKFLFWYLKSIRLNLVRAGKGGTQQNISQTVLKQIPIPLPSRSEQDEIVNAIEQQLTRIEVANAALQTALRNLKRYRALILHRAVLRGAETGEYRELADVAEIQGGIQKQPKRVPRVNHYPFLRVANVLRGRLDLSEIHQIELFGSELERLRLREGDLLVIEGNGSQSQIGRMAVWDGSIDDCVHQNHIIRARLGAAVLPAWVEIVWNSPLGQEAVQSVASSTSGLYTLSVRKVGQIRIPVPPLRDQEVLAADVRRALSISDEMEMEISTSVRRAASMQRAILKAAFTGRLGVAN